MGGKRTTQSGRVQSAQTRRTRPPRLSRAWRGRSPGEISEGGAPSTGVRFLDRDERGEWSGRRDSNPRPTAWKAVTLPLSYSRVREESRKKKMVEAGGFEPP